MKSIPLKKFTETNVLLPLVLHDAETMTFIFIDELNRLMDVYTGVRVTPQDGSILFCNYTTEEIQKLYDECDLSEIDSFENAVSSIYRKIYKVIGKDAKEIAA